MTIDRVTKLTQELLKGDNSKAEITPLLIELAIGDICRYCVPQKLVVAIEESEDAPGVYFRQIEDGADESGTTYKRFIVVPQIYEDTEQLTIEEELVKALVYFLCSYLTNKEPQMYEAKSKEIISIYNANRLHE